MKTTAHQIPTNSSNLIPFVAEDFLAETGVTSAMEEPIPYC